MKQKHQSTLVAGLLAVSLSLAGCAAMRGDDGMTDLGDNTSGGMSGTSGATGSGGSSSYGAGSATDASGNPTGSSGSSSSMGTMGSGSLDQSGSSGAAGSTGASGAASAQAGIGSAAAPNSTVLAIEVVPSASPEVMGSVGASGAAGATGSNIYRVTVRMDDGSTQVVPHGTTPDFRSGDRVNVTDGLIQR